MTGKNRVSPTRQSSFTRLKQHVTAGRSAGRRKSLQRYASTRKFGRRHELQREQRQHATAGIVEFSSRNPDEEDTVMEAQVRC